MSRSNPEVAIRRIGTEEAGLAAEVLGAAFQDDPMMTWLAPGDSSRAALSQAYFRMALDRVYLARGEVYLAGEPGFADGAALWLPPAVAAGPLPLGAELRLAWLLFRSAGFGGIRRAWLARAAVEGQHPSVPHYYLHALGVRPGLQRRGIGSALIRHVTARCDREGAPAYLENSNARNLPFYRRCGFEVIGQWQPPEGQPTIWFMTWLPKA